MSTSLSETETASVGSLRAWAFMSIMAFTLVQTHGGMDRPYLTFLPILLALLIFSFKPIAISVRAFELILATTIGCFLLTMYVGFNNVLHLPAVIYATQTKWIAFSQLFLLTAIFALIALVLFTRSNLKTKHLDWIFLVVCALIASAYIFIPLMSPHPIIDVWSVHEQGTKFFLHGQNPYAATYENIYSPGVQQTPLTPFGVNFPYLPGVIFWMMPWVAAGLDSRFSLLLGHILCAYLIFDLNQNNHQNGFTRYALTLLYLSFPVFPFVLEQGWNDALTVMTFLLSLWALKRQNLAAFFVAINALLLTKQFNIIAVPFLIYLGIREFRPSRIWKFTLYSVAGAALTSFFFLIEDWRGFLGSLYGLNYLKYANVHQSFPDRTDSFSLMNWCYLTIGWKSTMVFGCFMVVVIGWFASRLYTHYRSNVLRERAMVINTLAIIYLLLFVCSPASFCNYYWFATGIAAAGFAISNEESVFSTNRPLVNVPIALFIASRSWMVLVLRPFMPDTIYYHQVALKMAQGLRPYIDFPFEYPPLATLFIYAPQALSGWLAPDSSFHYRTIFMLFNFTFDLTMFLILQGFERRNLLPKAASYAYVAGSLVMADVIYDRLDLVMSLMVVLSVIMALASRRNAALTACSSGIFLKLTPVVTLPFIIMQNARFDAKLSRSLARNLIVSFVLIFGLFTASLVAFGSNFLDFLIPHLQRGIQIESIWASVFYLSHTLIKNSNNFAIVQNFGSYNLQYAPQVLTSIASAAAPILLVIFFCFWALKLIYDAHSFQNFSRAICIAIFITMLFGKVFSPQYLICLLTLFSFCGYDLQGYLMRTIYMLFGSALGLTSFLFRHYQNLVNREPAMWGILVARNAALLLLLSLMSYHLFAAFKKQSLSVLS